MNTLPYLTADLPGVGGTIKQRVEDFRVEEVPLYDACGEGTHVYALLEKRGIATPVAVDRLARHLGVKPPDIGVAGLKDAQAVTTQWISIEHVDPEAVLAYRDPTMRIMKVNRHGNKLRTGHLRGNRFGIRIRDVATHDLPRAEAILDVLARRGVPNYFGGQRFGNRGDTAALGEALIREDLDEFLRLFLGNPQPGDPPACRAARDAYEVGALDRALKRWPRGYASERKAITAYKKKHRPADAIRMIDKRMKRLYVSAFQSVMFNDVLARRIDEIDRVARGDLAQKTDSGGIFLVEDEATDLPRAQRGEISPTGPIPGYRGRLAEDRPGEIERTVLAEHAITPEDFRGGGPLKAKGSRRALRYLLEQPGLSAGRDEHGSYLEVQFLAPAGCYATIVLEELGKNRRPYG